MFRSGIEDQVATTPISPLSGHGRFTAPHEIEVNGEKLAGDKIFINTGTRPRILPIPGLEGRLSDQPQHHGPQGGAGASHDPRRQLSGPRVRPNVPPLRREVTVVELGDQIMPREDPEVSQTLKEALEEEGMSFRPGATTTKVTKTRTASRSRSRRRTAPPRR